MSLHGVERGTGTALVLLHGFGVDHRLLLPLDPVFEAAGGWRRIHLDLPGMGASPADGIASTDDVVRAVDAEVRRRVGDAPFALLANSFGAMPARVLAHTHRDRVLGLATIAGAFVADRGARDLDPRTVLREDPAALAVAGEAADDYAELAVVQSTDNARAFVRHVGPGIRAADPAALERIAARYALTREPEDEFPEPFGRPTLFVTARQDQVVGHRNAWARIEHYPRATFAVLDAAGHNVHLDRPAPVAALLADWSQRMREFSPSVPPTS